MNRILAPIDRAVAAPPWTTTQWFNGPDDTTLDSLGGRVVVLHAFQMLCPGCVSHGIPQAQRVQAAFDPRDVAVVGLHTVFEHHDAMTPTSLAAFLHEYRVTFPVGVDAAGEAGPTPRTMTRYTMRGTPTLVLIDRQGRRRLQHFGRMDDVMVGAAVATLVAEAHTDARDALEPPAEALGHCDTDGCEVPD